MQMENTRKYKYDTIRFLLIFLVVYGHFTELAWTRLYYIIYSFHIPALLFISGYFARFDPKKIVRRLIVPYVIFQVLYLFADAWINQTGMPRLQFSTPYWLLWYLATLIAYYVMIPLFDTPRPASRCAILAVTVLCTLLAGYDTSIGYFMSLSRTVYYLPFFLAGYYLRHPSEQAQKHIRMPSAPARRAVLICIFAAAALVCARIIWNMPDVSSPMLYGSYSYEAAEYTMGRRALFLLIACVWIVFLLLAVPDKKIPFLSVLGQNTMPVFLLHGFVRIYVKKNYDVLFANVSEPARRWAMAGIALAIVAAFGNPIFGKWFQRIFCFRLPGGKQKENA